MLKNRYYLGYVKFSGVEYKGRHQPLVTQELFDRVQEVLRTMPGAGNRQRRYHHYLKGLLWCQRCHRRLIVMRGKSKTGGLYFYYVCRGRQERQCDLPYLRVTQLEAAVASHYHTVSLPSDFRQQLIDLFDQAVTQHAGQGAKERAQLKKRLTELDRQEDRYIDLAIDPDWPRAKITEKLRAIRDERARLQARLNESKEELEQGHANARRILDYLEEPHELYERSGVRNRAKLNRLLFTKLWIDVGDDRVVRVSGDQLTDPFATVVYLRREQHPIPMLNRGNGQQGNSHRGHTGNGGLPHYVAFNDRVLSLLKPALANAQSSSNTTLAEDAGFEPARGCPQHDFQSCRPPSDAVRRPVFAGLSRREYPL